MEEKEGVDELTSKIRQLINENRKFLDRIMDDDFEPEEGEEREEEEAGVLEEL
jgi:hypothetical protein